MIILDNEVIQYFKTIMSYYTKAYFLYEAKTKLPWCQTFIKFLKNILGDCIMSLGREFQSLMTLREKHCFLTLR